METDPNRTLTDAETEEILREAVGISYSPRETNTVADLESVMEELGLPRSRVAHAMSVIATRRERVELAEKARKARRDRWRATARTLFRRTMWATVLSLVGLGFVLFVGVIAAGDRYQSAVAAQERVFAALGRQQTQVAMAQGFSDPVQRDAEIAGSANRVYIAKSDYDIAVMAYREEITTFPSNLPHILLRRWVVPRHMPLAREIWR